MTSRGPSPRAVAILGALTLAACTGTTFHRTVAAGAIVASPGGLGTCEARGGPIRVLGNGRYELTGPGIARLECGGANVELDVRPMATLAIRPVPVAASGERLQYVVVATDARGAELELGEEPSLAWTFSGSLAARPYPGCGDILPTCPSHADGFAVAREPGTGTIAVTLGASTATATTMVR